jgi:DNA repair protein RadC
MVSVKYRLTLKELPEDIRPRERLLKEGVEVLSDIELLAILLATGSREATALELASLVISRMEYAARQFPQLPQPSLSAWPKYFRI